MHCVYRVIYLRFLPSYERIAKATEPSRPACRYHGHVTVTRTHVFARRRNSNLSHNRRVAQHRCPRRRAQPPDDNDKDDFKITTMPKHTSFPTIPASAPTSPAITRKSERNPPATPQRSLPRPSVRHFQSPYTPINTLSTPYTPISLRSAPSSNGSSLATPASATGNHRRLSLNLSPEVSFQAKTTSKKSLADIADNWRTRANENGIKVESGDDSQYVDDEGKIVSL